MRGSHIHTQHPLALTNLLNGFDATGNPGASEDAWAAQLPQIVRGVFFPRGEANAESVARRVHTAFVQAFPDRAEATLLMSYDMSRLSAPFRLQNTPLW